MITPQDTAFPPILFENGLNQSMKNENVRFLCVVVKAPRLCHARLSYISCKGIALNFTPESLVVIHWSNPALIKYYYLVFN